MNCLIDLAKNSYTVQSNGCVKQLDNINFHSCASYLRKVSLKVNDVKMKLGLKKIIDFLQIQTNEDIKHIKASTKENFIKKQANKVRWNEKYDDDALQTSIKQENQRQFSFANVQTTKSLGNSIIYMRQSDLSNKQNMPENSIFSKLLYKQTVTKNDLFGKNCQITDIFTVDQGLQRLSQQNIKLTGCLKRMICLLEENNLIEVKQSIQFIDLEQFCEHFEQYQSQISTTINQLTEYTKQLEKSMNIFNSSIQNRSSFEQIQNIMKKDSSIMSQSKQVQVNCSDFQQKQIQVKQSIILNHSSIYLQIPPQKQPYTEQQICNFLTDLNQLKVKLRKQSQKTQEYQKIIHIQQRQIELFKKNLNDLKKVIQIYQKPVLKKRYIKFFDMQGKELNKTTI